MKRYKVKKGNKVKIGKKYFYEFDILPEKFKVPADYLSNEIVEEISMEIKEKIIPKRKKSTKGDK